MAEYIDREQLLEQIEEPMNWTDSEAELQEQADYQAFKNMVENAPTEDVVPRSEVENLQKRIANQREEIERLRKHTHNIQQSRNHYKAKAESVGKQLHNVLQGYHNRIDQAKQEVAKQIFEEIEKIALTHIDRYGRCIIDKNDLAELEKKYIGDNNG